MKYASCCQICGSDNLEYINLEVTPSIHCKDCNVLVTKLTVDQIDEILEIINQQK